MVDIMYLLVQMLEQGMMVQLRYLLSAEVIIPLLDQVLLLTLQEQITGQL